jgi:hypothetical protein
MFETKKDCFTFINDSDTQVLWSGYIYEIPETLSVLLGYNSTIELIQKIKIEVQIQVEYVTILQHKK